jgi:hypothetical protein
VIGKRHILSFATWATIMATTCPAATFHHQGVIAVRGDRFTGQGQFRFALIQSDTDTYLWTNDGSAVVHPSPPTEAVSLTVINGVYNIRLGDADVINLTAIPDSVFAANDSVFLRIWFDDGQGNGIHRLTPDVAISQAPYAVRAALCDAVVIPETDQSAVVSDFDGNVSVPNGDLTIEGGDVQIEGDLSVSGGLQVIEGDTTVTGNLTVDGIFTNFEVVGPFDAVTTTFGSENTTLTNAANSFCVLTQVSIGYSTAVSSGDIGTCQVRVSGAEWLLTARIDGGVFDDGQVSCEAHCFVFGGQ